MHSPRTTAAVVAALMALGACAPANTLDGTGPGASPVATVRVRNMNWADMNVYVVQGTSRTRLGMVTSMGTQTFRVPAMAVQGGRGLRVVADPIGGRGAFTSPELMVRPGEQVAMTVQNSLPLSSVAVWGAR